MPNNEFSFGTKAETLERLTPLVRQAEVLDLAYFPVSDWVADPAAVLERLAAGFGDQALAVRSSATGEDTAERSMAGAFMSRLGVDGGDRQALETAIADVVASYSGNPNDQILVQPMLDNVAVSGVIMTHDLQRGSPFYVIEYDDESGKTDSITGGTHVNKAVLVFRGCDDKYLVSERVLRMLSLARELEEICGPVPLDIEFGMTHDERVVLFQVRRISLQRRWLAGTQNRVSKRLEYIERFVENRSRPRAGLAGSRTVLGVMPDWNPAEIIGTTPRPLAASLYRELITRDVWRLARERMGYRHLPSEELMVTVGGHPFIDVRNSFNSLLPEGLEVAIADTLVDAWLDRLSQHPELHDKVEFEVAQTCLDFTFDEDFSGRYGNLLNGNDRTSFKQHLGSLTNQCLELGREGTLELARTVVDTLSDKQRQRRKVRHDRHEIEPLLAAADYLQECRASGTLPFSIIARHAFIAEALLRSAVARGAIKPERLSELRRSIRTVSGEMTSDFAAVCRGQLSPEAFMLRYGHLRPGTYDILSPRYDERDDLFSDSLPPEDVAPASFALSATEQANLDKLLAESGLKSVDAEGLITYARRAIAGREDAKFVFTRSLSDALAAIARWGEILGLGRDDLSYIEVNAMLDTLTDAVLDDTDIHFLDLVDRGRRTMELSAALKLNYLISDAKDIYVVPLHRSAPNFIGSGRIEGQPILLDSLAPAGANLYGKIVCIENADPGYDWIFTKGILGLITKFGGTNSHMAIRCAEFGLPAAIGCGERTFELMASARQVELNCADRLLRRLDAA
ncbi:MAG TPA: PEP-utilizing enzyme [Alphaproteobacteria bacterium]|nr:PEP-utilizing enzyme [Alphaproteobacteria bacterium]